MLIIALILLVVISLLAVTSVRNAGSTASVSGNVRTTELATQAAEIALRYCEDSILQVPDSDGGQPTYTLNGRNIEQVSISPDTPPKWQDTANNWDSASTKAFALSLDLVNQAGMSDKTYKRPPECMVERLSTTGDTTSSFVVTARGFGPEVVEADASRSRPVGSEVWLQSHIRSQ